VARRWETVVVGGGPVGLVAALAAARRGPTLLATRRPRLSGDARRIDVVPAPFLALLLEFGIHPAVLGVRHLHDARLVAWGSAEPAIIRGPATAHVERSALERALAERVGRTPGIETATLPGFPPPSLARRVIDATGRRAASARRRIHPPEPWIARTFWAPSGGGMTTAAQAFRLAALPEGYAYRLGSADAIMLGVVGAKAAVARSPPEAIERHLRACGAGWLLAGLPALGDLRPGRGGVASAQWSEGDGEVLRVGDAELARDALASQGLANGVSDALHLAAGESGPAWAERRLEQRERHLSALLSSLGDCRFRALPAWSRYAAFLAQRNREGSQSDRAGT
jgi:hypothetical protein